MQTFRVYLLANGNHLNIKDVTRYLEDNTSSTAHLFLRGKKGEFQCTCLGYGVWKLHMYFYISVCMTKNYYHGICSASF